MHSLLSRFLPPFCAKARLLYNGLDLEPSFDESLKLYAGRARLGLNKRFTSMCARTARERFFPGHPGLLFWKEICRRPRFVGAICPSGQYLARAMARSIPSGDGLIVETGAGTGAITSAILASGIQPDRLMVIEYSPAMCRILRARFPHITIIQGDAAHLSSYLPDGAKILAVVSSLPLMSFPEKLREKTLDETARAIGSHGCIIQFTYALAKTSPYERRGFDRDLLRIVPLNLPPAKVERFTARRH